MNKFILKLMVMVLAIGLISVCAIKAKAEQQQSDSLKVTVTVTPSISVDITETILPLGSVAAGEVLPSATGITVTNNGSGVKETYSLSLVNPVNPGTGADVWTAIQEDPVNGVRDEQYILNAAFDADGAGIPWSETNHALSTDPVPCTDTKFAGDQTGVAVSYNTPRMLWFQFKAPTQTDEGSMQEINVIVTAG